MQIKMIKRLIDLLMTITLLFLMALQVTGDKFHEFLGTAMIVLILVHNGLNWGWYKTIFKGKYNAIRIFRTSVNILLLASFVLTALSGIAMSNYVFEPLEPSFMSYSLARALHLSCSYWSFVLMSVHLGIHWSMIIARMNLSKHIWIFRSIASAIAIYGAYLFIKSQIFTYMFLLTEFAMLDYESPYPIVILNNLAMMITWCFIGHYLTKLITHKKRK